MSKRLAFVTPMTATHHFHTINHWKEAVKVRKKRQTGWGPQHLATAMATSALDLLVSHLSWWFTGEACNSKLHKAPRKLGSSQPEDQKKEFCKTENPVHIICSNLAMRCWGYPSQQESGGVARMEQSQQWKKIYIYIYPFPKEKSSKRWDTNINEIVYRIKQICKGDYSTSSPEHIAAHSIIQFHPQDDSILLLDVHRVHGVSTWYPWSVSGHSILCSVLFVCLLCRMEPRASPACSVSTLLSQQSPAFWTVLTDLW